MGDKEQIAGGSGRGSDPTPPTLQMPAAIRRVQHYGVVDTRDAETTREDAGRYVYADGGKDEAEIGRGGIGRVLLAFDRHLHREVAIKELRDTITGETHIARFLREARITGQLEHPGVVPVYELAHRADGSLYYGMRLVRGRTLRLAMDACAGNLEQRLRLLPHFVALCQTVAYAHSRGVIHRDIKPSNVMIGDFGETILLDWGIAGNRTTAASDAAGGEAPWPIYEGADFGTDAGLTQEGDFLGTPSYVSPEQARGDSSVLSGCGDVWSLGAVLYELLTGRPPFVADTVTGLLLKLQDETVNPPHLLEPQIPADLSSICLKALARDRALRYHDARELADEIEAFRSGRRVLAHEYTPWEHLVRFAVQKKGLLAAVAGVVVVVVVSLVLVSLSLRSEQAARGQAQSATARAEAARSEERRERLRAGLHFAQGAAEKAGRLLAERRLLSARIYATAALVHNPAYRASPLADDSFAAGDPAASELALESLGRELMARSRAAVRLRRVIRSTDPLNGVALSSDGTQVVAVSKTGRLLAWDTLTGAHRFRIQAHQETAWAVAFSPTAGLLATSGRDGRLKLFRASDGTGVASVEAHRGDVFALAFSASGAQVATGGADGVVRLWRVPGLEPAGELRGNEGAVHGVAFSPDGRRIAGAGRDRTVRVWPLDGNGDVLVIPGHEAVVRHVAFSPDGRRIATASYDKTVRIFDAAVGVQLQVLQGHEDEVLQVGYSPDGRRLISAGWDRTVRLWEADGTPVMAIEGHTQAVWGGSFSRDGRLLATAGEDGTVRLWEMLTPLPAFYEPGQGYLWSIAHSPDGQELATAGADGTVRLWSAAGGLKRRLEDTHDLIGEVAYSPDGRKLASAGYDGLVRLYEVAGGPAPRVLRGHTGFVRAVAYSPDSRMLASAGDDGLIRLWDTGSGVLLGGLGKTGGPAVRRVAFSPSGRWLASACGDGRVRIWSPGSRTLAREVPLGPDAVAGLAFAPDGATLAACGMDGVIALIDPDSGVVRARLRRSEQGIYTVRWSPDGRHLVATGDDSVVTLWDTAGGTPRMIFRLGQSVMAADFSPAGRVLVLADSRVALTIPLEFGAAEADPEAMLKQAQQDAGMLLKGFNLVQEP